MKDLLPPLHGLRVLDAARVLAGPFCGQLLADLGADVVKLERPGAGDDTRGWGPPFVGPLSAYFMSCNRNKRSIALDIGVSQGYAAFEALLKNTDILLENFRTDSAEKLGLTPEALLAKYPRLIVCSISGFGRTGPLKDAPGYDFAIQALSGLMSITGEPTGVPMKVGVAVVDILTGLYAANAVLAAVHARHRSGHGYAIDLALHDCALASQVNVAQAYLASGAVPARQGNAHLQIVPYQLFETQDGWLVLNVGNDGQWRAFCTAAGDEALGNNPIFAKNQQRVERRAEVVPLVEALMKKYSTKEWEKRLSEANVPHAVVRNYAQIFADENTLARGMKVTVKDPAGQPVDLLGNPIKFFGQDSALPSLPPLLGADTHEVLKEWGNMTDIEIKQLKEKKVV